MNTDELEKLTTDNELLQALIIQVEKDFTMAGVDLNFKQTDFTIQQFIAHICKRLEEQHKENHQKFCNLFYRIDVPLPTHTDFKLLAEKLIKREFLKVWTRRNNVF
ncbi:MAG: hypothetical protein V4667_00070 [Bacteroidota bacterium]